MNPKSTKIVILGGGFGGIYTALHLEKLLGRDPNVEVTLVNLPQGYAAPKVTIPGNQETFELTVSSPAVTAAADLPNIAFRVTTAGGQPLAANLPVATKVAPGQ